MLLLMRVQNSKQLTQNTFYKQRPLIRQRDPPLEDHVHLEEQTPNRYWPASGRQSIGRVPY